MNTILAALLLLGSAGTTGVTIDAAQDDVAHGPLDPTNQAVREAFAALPKREKVGRIRGLLARSEVRFVSSPKTVYFLEASFSTPQRSRVILSSADGAFERYQVGPTLFGRDLVRNIPLATTRSFVLKSAGRTETLMDIELRRALFFWPDAPSFTGEGTTFTAEVEDLGVLLATVDEAAGLPTRIRSIGQDGKTAVEFHSIIWSTPKSPGARPWPATFTFAAGGSDLWTESVQEVDGSWLFSDVWFLPFDRVTCVVGSDLAGGLRLRAIGGAWVFREAPGDLPVADEPPGLQPSADAAAAAWDRFRKVASKAFPGADDRFVSPYVELILDAKDRPVAVEYEVRAPGDAKPPGEGWRWRAPRNVWAYPIDAQTGEASSSRLQAARQQLASAAGTVISTRVRFRVGEESLGGVKRNTGIGLELVADAPVVESPPAGNPGSGR